MKTYRFSELSHSSQIKAVYDYLIGWEETHPENDLFFNEIYDTLLVDNNEEYEYKKDGTHIPDGFEDEANVYILGDKYEREDN